MDAKALKNWREAFYKELRRQSEGGQWNVPAEKLDERFRRIAFGWSDSDIEELAAVCTPAEAAAEELL